MPRRPLDREVSRIAAKRARAAAEIAEFDRQLAVLQRAQAELIEAVVEEHQNEVLHNRHSDATINTMHTEMAARDGDKQQARMRTRNDLKNGKIPHPDTLPCSDCGDIWHQGRPHHQYDHHLGYGAAHHRDVQAVCPRCHIRRDLDREKALGTGGIRGARLGTKHVGATRIREVDGSVARFAAKHGLFATTVRSWYAAGDAARKIPRKWCEKLKREPYRVPESAWKNGIEE